MAVPLPCPAVGTALTRVSIAAFRRTRETAPTVILSCNIVPHDKARLSATYEAREIPLLTVRRTARSPGSVNDLHSRYGAGCYLACYLQTKETGT